CGILSASFPLQAQPARSPCLRFGEIWSWKALDNYTIVAEDNQHNKFRLSLMGYCPSVQYRERVGFKSLGAMHLTCMSAGDDVIVSNPGTGPQNCPIKSITAYTPAMEQADKAAAAAKASGATPP
ncbi:MAG TPA: DUF6491 family protein, partial [Rhizomicrobium sp.]